MIVSFNIQTLKCACSFLFFRLGLAYAGSNKNDVITCLLPVFSDPKSNMEVLGMAALALGMVCVGSCNGDVTGVILQTLMDKNEADLKNTFARFLALGLGLLYLGNCGRTRCVLLLTRFLATFLERFSEVKISKFYYCFALFFLFKCFAVCILLCKFDLILSIKLIVEQILQWQCFSPHLHPIYIFKAVFFFFQSVQNLWPKKKIKIQSLQKKCQF